MAPLVDLNKHGRELERPTFAEVAREIAEIAEFGADEIDIQAILEREFGQVADDVGRAVAREREECAKLAEIGHFLHYVNPAAAVASAIRRR